jgi:peptidoglycan/LPS O-acetylase OafA/YrhL
VAFLVAVLAAYAFNRLVERPAHAWAARIGYGDRKPETEPAVLAGSP